jgi:FeS assembly SUF system regulator
MGVGLSVNIERHIFRHWKAMLRISKITDYGTLLMSQMALQPERVHSASELALLLGLGLPTVSKILKGLSRHGLLVAVRGLHGGYSLARPPERISVADIVDALEEQPFGLTQCSAASGVCARETDCGVRVSWHTINRIVRRALEDVSVASMAQPVPAQQPVVLERSRRADRGRRARTTPQTTRELQK